MTPEELQNAREKRQFWERIVILFLAAIPSWFGMLMQWQSATRQLAADVDRVRIEDKVDKAAVAATTAAVKTQEIKNVADEVKAATVEVKTAVETAKEEIKSGMDK